MEGNGNTTDAQDKQANPQDNKSDSPTPIPPIIPPNNSDSPPNTANDISQKEKPPTSRFRTIIIQVFNKYGKIILDILIAFFTGILAIAAIYTSYKTREQMIISQKNIDSTFARADRDSEMQKMINDSTLAQQKSSIELQAVNNIIIQNALSELIKSERENVELENRAFVSLFGVSDIQFVVGEKPICKIFFKNMGKTPAYLRFAIISIITDSVDFNKIKVSKILDSIINTKTQNIVVGANMEGNFPYTYIDTINNYQFYNLKSGKLQYYIWGKFSYKDFFGKQRVTNFSGGFIREIVNNIGDIDNNRNLRGYSPLGKYNDAD